MPTGGDTSAGAGRRVSPRLRRSLAGSLAVLLALGAGASGCADREPQGAGADEEWTPDPQPETKDFRLLVTAEPTARLGEDIVLRVRVENGGSLPVRLNVPRLSRDSVSFKVRGAPFDVAWLDPRRVKESPQGAQPDPPLVKETGPGQYVEGEIRVTAALCGTFAFAPVYACQALGAPLAAEPVKVEVTPSPEGSVLGVRLETTHGTIDARLRADLAFQTATSFATLVRQGFYDGVKFHRVIAGFMAQGGDPEGQGWGGPGYTLRRELHGKLPHTRGVLSMARQSEPDTAGSQFFIMFRDDPNLDRLGYTTFGEMIAGADTLKKIESLGATGNGPGEAPRETIQIKKASLLFLK